MSADHHGPAAHLVARVRHVESLLERRGLIDAKELDQALATFLARASPANGARLVARAWLDERFRTRLLADANAARTVLRATPNRRAISLIGTPSARCSRRISAQFSTLNTS